MDMLKRELAPVVPEAWDAIEEEAGRVLKLNLAGRKLVDVDGPKGWGFAGLSTGRLKILDDKPVPDVHAGVREVLPIVELRTPVVLDLMELDSVERGGDPDLSPVAEAAERIARAEDNAIFNGYGEAGIRGIIPSFPGRAQTVSEAPLAYLEALIHGRETLRGKGIGGPYALALGSQPYQDLARAADDGYPVIKRVEEITEGPVVHAPALSGGLLVSTRGGDYGLTVGQDYAVGFVAADRNNVELYLTVSFTFRVREPEAALPLQFASRKRGR